MNNINLYIANANGSLSHHKEKIITSFNKASKVCIEKLQAQDIDVIVVDAPYNTITELGVGGYTPSSNLIYISINPEKTINEIDLLMTFIHEMHHAVRWRNPGYGKTLKEALLTEGLATLYEEEVTGILPIYAKGKITKDQINYAEKFANDSNYDHYKWFISGDNKIPKWFGYAYGYKLASYLSKIKNKTASELVNAAD